MSDATELAGKVVGGKYQLDSVLGQGGMGVVYKGRHLVTGRRVAVKFLLSNEPDRRERFLREARAMGRLHHRNVVDVYDVGEEQGRIFLVMEFLRGIPLGDLLEEVGAMSPARAIARLMPALSGVAAAHQAGLVHRDLKPDNLFVLRDADGVAYDTKVLDFGLAGGRGLQREDKVLTVAGALLGTPLYMAPEQAGDDPSDARADQFSLALFLFEMLTGDLPYSARELRALLLELLTLDYPAPIELRPDLPPELSACVARAMSREPEERFASVTEFALALEPFGDGTRFEAPRRSQATDLNLPLASDAPLAATAPPAARAEPIPHRPAAVMDAGDQGLAATVDASARPRAALPAAGVSAAPQAAPAPRRPPLFYVAIALGLAVLTVAVGGIGWAIFRSPSAAPTSPARTSEGAPAASPAPSPAAAADVSAPAGEPQLPEGRDVESMDSEEPRAEVSGQDPEPRAQPTRGAHRRRVAPETTPPASAPDTPPARSFSPTLADQPLDPFD